MNILDFEFDPDSIVWAGSNISGQHHPADLLATIFEGQRVLMYKYHSIEEANGCIVVDEDLWGEIDDRNVQMRIKDLNARSIEELMEAMNCFKNKPWKNSFVATDRDHFYEELADALHFFIELCITAGLTADSLFTLYFQKHAVNRFRQDSNY